MYQVDLNPSIQAVAVRPTAKNPDISVVIGKDEFGYKPKAVIYPDTIPPEVGVQKAKQFEASSKDCPVCKKYATEQATANIAYVIALAVLVGGAFIVYRMIKEPKEA